MKPVPVPPIKLSNRGLAPGLLPAPRGITITRRSDDYHACLTGNAGIWDRGKTRAEAIGNLIQTHPEAFGLVIAVES